MLGAILRIFAFLDLCCLLDPQLGLLLAQESKIKIAKSRKIKFFMCDILDV
jgi:hypothetical protein